MEYVEDQIQDYGRLHPSYEQIFSRPDSPLSELEHHVSAYDPNMSSAARYSPTPVSLSASPFPSPPLITTTETVTPINTNYDSELTDQSTSQSICHSENSSDFTDSTSEDLVSSVENDMILMPGKFCTVTFILIVEEFLIIKKI